MLLTGSVAEYQVSDQTWASKLGATLSDGSYRAEHEVKLDSRGEGGADRLLLLQTSLAFSSTC